MSGPEKKAALCPSCRKKAEANQPYERRTCDGAGCARTGCRHLIAGDGKTDLCIGCRGAKARAAKATAKAGTP